MFELHGYRPNAIEVTADLVLSHKHDDYRTHAADVLRSATDRDLRFSNYHTIVDVDGHQHTVLSVGESRTDTSAPAAPSRTACGFMVEVSQDENDATRRAVQQARRGSASIQQSMGLLMGSLGLTEDAAFALISRVSQHHNVKVRDLTRRFMAAVVAHAAESPRELTHVLIGQANALALERSIGARLNLER